MLVALLGLGAVAPAEAASVPRKFAGIVIDAKTGKVLYESASTAARYPASVTKVMTLYILFQELAAKNITLDTRFNVSKYAASASPTKLGLRAGSTIRVEDAIKAIVTISANDIARVIAENIAGSEGAFAKRMTATARALGMKNTTYRNASGLPDSGQVTTVADQARLGIAVYEHFPKYYAYFQTKSFAYGKRVYGNHNRLLGANGVDGIKTGYTNASGFNLLTAARKDGRHIVVAAFGFPSGGARDAKVRELVKTYMPKARSGDYLEAALIDAPGRKGSVVLTAEAKTPPMPKPYPSFRAANAYAVADDPLAAAIAANSTDVGDEAETLVADASLGADAPMPAARPRTVALDAVNAVGGGDANQGFDVIGAWIGQSLALGATPAAVPAPEAVAVVLPPVGIGENGEAVDPAVIAPVGEVQLLAPQPVLVASAAPPVATDALPTAPGRWIIQIGAAPSEDGAKGLLASAAQSIGSAVTGWVEQFEKNGQVFFRARLGGFGSRDAASGVCTQLKAAQMSCLAMQS
jgi:D-alanyl-D-alanine carboxypeptidase